jgi:hypothetical protein
MRGIFRSGVQCSLDDFGDLRIGEGPRTTRPIFISQSIDAILG